MRIEYEGLEGCNAPWISSALQDALAWTQLADVTPEFFTQLHLSLRDFYTLHRNSFMQLPRQVKGLKGMVTNSTLSVYPQV